MKARSEVPMPCSVASLHPSLREAICMMSNVNPWINVPACGSNPT